MSQTRRISVSVSVSDLPLQPSRDRDRRETMGSEEGMGSCENHRLCANGCGFFGTAAMMNLCSKCYRDLCVKEEQSASAKAAVDKSLNLKSLPSTTTAQQKSLSTSSYSDSSLASSSASWTSNLGNLESDSRVKNRCWCCKKRVGLTGFKCRCGSIFCSTHRYPEMHACKFDFKALGREAIAKANPVVKGDKLERF